jgi:hypothetical protein
MHEQLSDAKTYYQGPQAYLQPPQRDHGVFVSIVSVLCVWHSYQSEWNPYLNSWGEAQFIGALK